MIDLIKKIFGVYVTPDEQKILDAIDQSGLKTMRVIGRGTLTVDVKEVTNTEKFKGYVAQAKQVVHKND